MNILVIEDDAQVREMMVARIAYERGQRGIEGETLQAADLQGALRPALECEAILCDGSFPIVHNGIIDAEAWVSMWAFARKREKKFILLSGDVHSVTRAKRLKIPAFLKPEEVDQAMAELFAGVKAEVKA